MKKISLLLITILLAAASTGARNLPVAQRKIISDSIEQQLKKTSDPEKRLRMVYNIFDLGTYNERYRNAERVYNAAREANDTAAIFDALRLLTVAAGKDDSLQAVQLSRAALMPLSSEQRETVTFISITRARNAANKLSDDQRPDQLQIFLRDYDDDQQVDIYRRVEVLSTIISFLQDRPNSRLLQKYISELESIVRQLPKNSGALRSKFYTTSAAVSTLSGNHADAVHADSMILDIIKELEHKHHTSGRVYRNYETNYFTTYTRMLCNYKALDSATVDTLYNRIQRLVELNPDIRHDYMGRNVVPAYYAMAKGRYKEAVPLLQKTLLDKRNDQRRYILLRMLVEAATKTNDKEALLQAYQLFTPLLEQKLNMNDADRMMEYRILSNVNELQQSQETLVELNRSIRMSHQQQTIFLVTTLSCILVILLAIVLFMYYRRRISENRLQRAHADLLVERDNLKEMQQQLITARDDALVADRQKSDFINTISHEVSEPVTAILGYTQLIVDSVDERRRATLEKFINIIELNGRLLQTLVNDVLDASELESSSVSLKCMQVSMADLAETAAEPYLNRLQPGVTMSISPLSPDDVEATVYTDAVRAEQVLRNLISNAVKFTDKGSIHIFYGIDRTKRQAKFIIEDTGPGIPAEMSEKVFDRFEKLGHYNQGIGLGLYICRLLSQLLNATVVIDTTYTDGARLVFALPID